MLVPSPWKRLPRIFTARGSFELLPTLEVLRGWGLELQLQPQVECLAGMELLQQNLGDEQTKLEEREARVVWLENTR